MLNIKNVNGYYQVPTTTIKVPEEPYELKECEKEKIYLINWTASVSTIIAVGTIVMGAAVFYLAINLSNKKRDYKELNKSKFKFEINFLTWIIT